MLCNIVSLLQDGITDVSVVPSSTVSPTLCSPIRDQPIFSTQQHIALDELRDAVQVSRCIVIISIVSVGLCSAWWWVWYGIVCWLCCTRGDYALQSLLM